MNDNFQLYGVYYIFSFAFYQMLLINTNIFLVLRYKRDISFYINKITILFQNHIPYLKKYCLYGLYLRYLSILQFIILLLTAFINNVKSYLLAESILTQQNPIIICFFISIHYISSSMYQYIGMRSVVLVTLSSISFHIFIIIIPII